MALTGSQLIDRLEGCMSIAACEYNRLSQTGQKTECIETDMNRFYCLWNLLLSNVMSEELIDVINKEIGSCIYC